MIAGVLVERSDDPIAGLRQRVLRRQTWYHSAKGGDPVAVCLAASSEPFDARVVAKVLLDSLVRHGIVTLTLDRQLTNQELISLASSIGEPQEQLDPLLQPWVEDTVILNLRADHDEIDDRRWKLLFAENYVMLHTELAGRPIGLQPRYLLFQCVNPPQRDLGGQTLVVPMDAVRARLTFRQAAILRVTHHAGFMAPPPFLSDFEGRDVVTYKDAEGEALPWEYRGEDPTVSREEVEDTLRALQAAIYEPSAIRGLGWQRHMLGAFDNTRFLHGRAFASRPQNGPARHLREIRVFCNRGSNAPV